MRFIRSIAIACACLLGSVAPAQDQPSLAPSLLPQVAPKSVEAAPAKIPGAAGAHALTREDLNTWLDGYMPYALRAADIPGAVVTVVKDGSILTARGFGYSDVARRRPVDPERTLFRPGSVSKLITWTAAMQMVEAGKLDLDRDINTYLDFKIPPFQGKPVTLRQLMTHTAGFEEAAKDLLVYDTKELLPLEAYLKRWTPKRIFAPGTTPAYSNWATTLTGYLVQRVSGEDFDTYVERHVFAPLGMRNSTFRQPLPANLRAQLATGYPTPGKAKGFEIVNPAPAGSLSASGTDMARFMLAHLQRGELNGQRILRPETADMMHDSPLNRVDPMSLMPPLNRMELGFFETNVNGREVIGHLGDTSAFHTSLHLLMKEGVGIYFSFNSSGKAGAAGSLRTALFEDFADRYFADIAPPDGRVDAKTAARHARMMAGNWIPSRRADSSFLAAFYWLTGQAKVGVGPKGELVIPSLTNPGGRPREWVEIAPFVWRNVNGHDRLAAKVIDGKVVRWTFDLAAPFEMFDRVPASRSSSWLMPALIVSLLILLFTALHWPIAWAIRRRYKALRTIEGPVLRARRAARLAAALVIGLVVAWGFAMNALLGSGVPSSGLDGVLLVLQGATAVILIGAVLVAGWNLWATVRSGSKWTRTLWALLVLLASLLLLYIAVTMNLIAMSVNY